MFHFFVGNRCKPFLIDDLTNFLREKAYLILQCYFCESWYTLFRELEIGGKKSRPWTPALFYFLVRFRCRAKGVHCENSRLPLAAGKQKSRFTPEKPDGFLEFMCNSSLILLEFLWHLLLGLNTVNIYKIKCHLFHFADPVSFFKTFPVRILFT